MFLFYRPICKPYFFHTILFCDVCSNTDISEVLTWSLCEGERGWKLGMECQFNFHCTSKSGASRDIILYCYVYIWNNTWIAIKRSPLYGPLEHGLISSGINRSQLTSCHLLPNTYDIVCSKPCITSDTESISSSCVHRIGRNYCGSGTRI